MSVNSKIEDAKVNWKLIGDEITVSKINKTHGDGGKGPKGPKQPTTREILVDFIKEQREFNRQQSEFNNRVETQFKAHGWTK